MLLLWLLSEMVVPLLLPLWLLLVRLLQLLVHVVLAEGQVGVDVVVADVVVDQVAVVGVLTEVVMVMVLMHPPLSMLCLLLLPCAPCMAAVSRVRWSPVWMDPVSSPLRVVSSMRICLGQPCPLGCLL